jgi:hypothetical protein
MFLRMVLCMGCLGGAFLTVSCGVAVSEPVPPTEHGYWKHKPYQTTVRLYNGERMAVTKYEKVWVDMTPPKEKFATQDDL